MAALAAGTDLTVAVAVGIESVVLRVDRDLTSGNIDNQCFNAFIAFLDEKRSIQERYGSVGVNTIISRGNSEVTACNRDLSGGVDAVISCLYIEAAGLYVQISVFLFIGSDHTVISRI